MPILVPGLLALVLLAPGPQTGYKLEITDAQRIEGMLTYKVSVPRLSATDWLVVAGRAPELPCQVRTTTKLDPSGVARTELSPLHRPIVAAQLRGTALEKGFQVRITYQATLRSRKLVPLGPDEKAPVVAALRSDDRQHFLAATETLDFKSREFQKWLEENGLRRKKGEDELDFARRVFVCIRDTYTYKWPTGHDAKASTNCRAHRGDCGSYSVVFVSALRANGIPARVLVGRWAESSEAGARPGALAAYQTHVKAEFFVPGVGWVPVDVTRSQGDRSAGGFHYFGNDPGDFLVQNLDYDLQVDTIHFGRKRVEHLQGIVYWASGGGSWDGQMIREDWQVRRLPSR